VPPTGGTPAEPAGPAPAHGSNGPDVLGESGVVRSDITTSFAGMSGTAEGVPSTLELTLLDIAGGGGPLAGAAIYVWHCDRDGAYSLYDASATDQNYLRGVQVADKQGKVEFMTVVPACYSGRWPHIHFEVYENEAAAAKGSTKLRTSQLALPKDLCDSVYGTADGYDQSVTNLSQVSLDTDGVFADGYSSQLAKWSGSVEKGIALKLNVGV
jgi:protocatechuate 3,4-dioxygenase beta subunit